ncbi:hypothetical protein [Umezawaea beigongshangensis]|uniref:hypothetical protein n=1 Tax=Umezawaea beigongshangensis TaxID=2780383 RepID=UPI0018F22D04|nr:hypothetical protein [Umezawaea beigongshangensis]
MTNRRTRYSDSRSELVRAQRRYTERVAVTIVFTTVQAWATIAVVTQLRIGGVLAVATALVLSASLVAVADSWRDVRTARRHLLQRAESVFDDEDADIAGMPERASSAELGPAARRNKLVRL